MYEARAEQVVPEDYLRRRSKTLEHVGDMAKSQVTLMPADWDSVNVQHHEMLTASFGIVHVWEI